MKQGCLQEKDTFLETASILFSSRNFLDSNVMSALRGSWTNAHIYDILSPKLVLFYGLAMPIFTGRQIGDKNER